MHFDPTKIHLEGYINFATLKNIQRVVSFPLTNSYTLYIYLHLIMRNRLVIHRQRVKEKLSTYVYRNGITSSHTRSQHPVQPCHLSSNIIPHSDRQPLERLE